MLETEQRVESPREAEMPVRSSESKAALPQVSKREQTMPISIAHENLQDWEENQERGRGAAWRTDLLIMATCLLLTVLVIAMVLAWTGWLHF